MKRFGAAALGSPVATLSAYASGSGSVAVPVTGSGSPVATLSAYASGSADASLNISGSGAAVATLSAFAVGVASHPVPARPRAKGGGLVLIHHDAPRKKKKRKRPRPTPRGEAAPLAELEPVDLPAPRVRVADPETWARAMLRVRLPVRLPEPAAPEPKVDTTPVEDRLMQYLLQTLGGPAPVTPVQLPELDEENAPFLLMRFLRLGK